MEKEKKWFPRETVDRGRMIIVDARRTIAGTLRRSILVFSLWGQPHTAGQNSAASARRPSHPLLRQLNQYARSACDTSARPSSGP
jgi:hypothetical protein